MIGQRCFTILVKPILDKILRYASEHKLAAVAAELKHEVTLAFMWVLRSLGCLFLGRLLDFLRRNLLLGFSRRLRSRFLFGCHDFLYFSSANVQLL